MSCFFVVTGLRAAFGIFVSWEQMDLETGLRGAWIVDASEWNGCVVMSVMYIVA